MKTVEFEILGKKYYLKSSDPELTQKRAQELNLQLEELNEKFNTVDQNKLFVLYMLMLLEKYSDELQKSEKLEADLKQLEVILNNISVD